MMRPTGRFNNNPGHVMFSLSLFLAAAAQVGEPVAREAAVIRNSHIEVAALLLAGAVLAQLSYELRRLYVRSHGATPGSLHSGEETFVDTVPNDQKAGGHF